MSSKWFLLLQFIAFFFVIMFELEPIRVVADSNSTTIIIRCIDVEMEALLTFKQSLVDEYDHLSSWGPEYEKRDCCYWRGVACSNTTGHVNMLDLPDSNLKGTISPALLKLHELRHLDLGWNNFSGSPIPDFIGSLSKLRYLDLCFSLFEGPIPPQLGNLSRLHHLNLAWNFNLFRVGSLDWLSHLSSLTYLNLYGNNLSKSSDWFLVVGNLHSLKVLYLDSCVLPPINPSLFISHFNFSHTTPIESLSLSYNNLTSSIIYPWLFNLSRNIVELDLARNQLKGSIPEAFEQYMVSLKSLYLYSNELEGGIPKFFGNMCSLNTLYLPGNKLSGQLQNLSTGCLKSSLESLYLQGNDICGPIPEFGEFSSLKTLYLSDNRLNGTINKSFRHMFKLEHLSLAGNSLTGVISESFFSNLSNLQSLDLSANSLALKLSHDWVPPFQLRYLDLASCNLGPNFPKWLQNHNQIDSLDISNNGISDTVPDWFWDLSSSKLYFLNISGNQIKGKLPDLSLRFDTYSCFIDISSNQFDGQIPPLPSNVSFLNLSKNKFSGSISFICSINSHKLEVLDISNNLLSGRLPDCWMQLDSLGFLNLANNSFFENIPNSMGFLQNIQTLSLHNNRLTGEVPSFLKNCSNLRVLDLGNNVLGGEIPTWIGECLSNLVVLSLKSNKFHGNIPFQLCLLASIQVLDLSLNNISGIIPKCFNNFTVMTQEKSSNLAITFHSVFFANSSTLSFSYFNNVELTWKGNKYEYKTTLGLVKSLDLSNNKLGGAIPEEIMDLVGLIGLNLSRNHLTGQISSNIGRLKSLDFLDLSRNQLFGGIPSSLSQLSRLGVMDVSYNNLSGKIPTGTQLQSFNASVYAGNPELCGPPLQNCLDGESAPDPVITEDRDTSEDDEDQLITMGFYISLILGFIVGFCGVCGTLLLNRPWRHGYFGFLTGIKDWLYVTAAINITKLQRRFRN